MAHLPADLDGSVQHVAMKRLGRLRQENGLARQRSLHDGIVAKSPPEDRFLDGVLCWQCCNGRARLASRVHDALYQSLTDKWSRRIMHNHNIGDSCHALEGVGDRILATRTTRHEV
jgi:hypothetical protein